MIAQEVINIQLRVNSVASINTGKYFTQHDNMVGRLSFTISTEDNIEINYSDIVNAVIVLKYQDNTVSEPSFCKIKSDKKTYDLLCDTLCITGSVRC